MLIVLGSNHFDKPVKDVGCRGRLPPNDSFLSGDFLPKRLRPMCRSEHFAAPSSQPSFANVTSMFSSDIWQQSRLIGASFASL
ncbi:MAG: hypothetical protein FJ271_29130 [Planctomycetes bacterium]|nr:hypothetical protein [Planctomycetota bacterium]